MRDFRYPTAIPPLEVQPVDPKTGEWSWEWRRYFESLQIQVGGQGGDAIYDAEGLAANAEQLSILAQNVTRLQQDVETLRNDGFDQQAALARKLQEQAQDVEALRAGVDDARARKIARGDILPAEVFRSALADNAASRTVSGYEQEHEVWPTGFGPTGSNANASGNDTVGTNWPSKTLELKPSVSLTDVKAGSPVLIWISYKLTPTSSAYDWMYFEHEVFRRSAGAGIPSRVAWPSGATDIGSNPYTSGDGLIQYEPLFDGVDSGNNHVSGNMGANAIRRVKPGMNGMIFIDLPPADGDYDYWFRWMVDARYAFAVDGFEGASSTRNPFLSDVYIIVTNLAK